MLGARKTRRQTLAHIKWPFHRGAGASHSVEEISTGIHMCETVYHPGGGGHSSQHPFPSCQKLFLAHWQMGGMFKIRKNRTKYTGKCTQIHCEACDFVHMLVKCISQMLVRTSISHQLGQYLILSIVSSSRPLLFPVLFSKSVCMSCMAFTK